MISKNKIKYIRSLELKKNRNKEGKFVAEGFKVVDDLLALQPAEGEQVAEAFRPQSAPSCAPALGRGDAARRPPVPAELPARKLGGLPLLGYRARGLRRALPFRRPV